MSCVGRMNALNFDRHRFSPFAFQADLDKPADGFILS
jgi:hypothetical protein